jgi:hypothetical protein
VQIFEIYFVALGGNIMKMKIAARRLFAGALCGGMALSMVLPLQASPQPPMVLTSHMDNVTENEDYLVIDIFNIETGEFLYSERIYRIDKEIESDNDENSQINDVQVRPGSRFFLETDWFLSWGWTVVAAESNNWIAADVNVLNMLLYVPERTGSIDFRIVHTNGRIYGSGVLAPNQGATIRGVPSGGYRVEARSYSGDPILVRIRVTDWFIYN